MNMTKMKSLCAMALAVVCLSTLTGCSSWSGPPEPDYKIGLFDYSWQDAKGESTPIEYGGRIIYVKPRPIINSANIERIETFEVKGGKGMRLILSHHGKMRWHQASAMFRGKDLAIMLDDKYRGRFKVRHIGEDGILVLPGPYIPEEVEMIREKVKDNFKR